MHFTMFKSLSSFAWRIGVPVIVGLLTWGPYLALNVANGVSWPFWRVPFVPIVIFDSGTYFEMFGASLSWLSYGSHLRSFDSVVRILGHVIPTSWSVAEAWLLTLWFSVVVSVWLFAKCVSLWSGCSVARSRWFSIIALSTFVLPFMPRPGVFTWYIAFCLFGFIGIWQVLRSFDRSAYVSALAWTIGSCAVTWIYPHFFLHTVLWLAVVWCIHLHSRFPKIIRMMGAMGILAVIPIFCLLMPWVMRPELRLAYEVQKRTGLTFTRLPVFSNSLLLVFAWIALMVLATYFFRMKPEVRDRLSAVTVGWVTLFGAWLSNVFTDAFIANDHFRAPAVILSWISLFVVWTAVSRAREAGAFDGIAADKKWLRIFRGFLLVFFGCCFAMFSVYVFKKVFVFRGDFLNVIHASHWIALMVATIVIWGGIQANPRWAKSAAWMFIAVAVLLGVAARIYVFSQEAFRFPSYTSYVPAISWIRMNLSKEDGICADPQHGEIFGAFSARLVYPTYVTEFLPKSDEEILNDLRTEMGYYNVQSVIARDVYIRVFDSMDTTCSQFQSSVWSKLFAMAGRSDFDEAAGCLRKAVQSVEEKLSTYAIKRERNDAQFRKLCPAVIIANDQRSFWSLPSDYTETKINETFSVWRSTLN